MRRLKKLEDASRQNKNLHQNGFTVPEKKLDVQQLCKQYFQALLPHEK
jgi:hypothetical protein